MLTTFLIVCIAYFLGFCIGKQYAHDTIATECEKLGGFFVGNRTFKCISVSESSDTQRGNNEVQE